MATPSPPVVTSIICTSAAPSASLDVTWNATGDYTGPFTLAVQDSDGNVAGTTSGGPSGGSWAGFTLDATKAWFLVVGTSDPNIHTNPIPILVAQPVSLTTAYDGTSVTITWSNPTGPVPPQIQLALRTNLNWQYFPAVSNYGSGNVVANPAIIAATQPWWGVAAAVIGMARGPWSAPAPVLKSTPPIAAMTTGSANNLPTARISTPVSSTYSQGQPFRVRLYAGSDIFHEWASVASTPLSATLIQVEVSLADAGWPFPPGYDYAFAIGQSSPSAVGPLGRRQSYPIASPSIRSVTYAVGTPNDSIAVGVAPPPGIAFADGAQLILTNSNGGVVTTATISGFAGSFTVATGTAANCSVMAATMIGVASGPAGAAKVPLIVQAPTLSAIAFDGEQITVSCSAVTGATGYVFSVLNEGQTLASKAFGVPTGVIPAAAGDMKVIVAAIGPSTAGPACAPVAVLTSAPALNQLLFNSDGSATATFTGVGTTQILNYQILDGDAVIQSGSLAAGVGDVPIAAQVLNPAQRLSVRAQLSAAGSPTSTGPWSDASPIATTPPSHVSVKFNGRAAIVSWQASQDPRVTGYRAGVYNGSTTSIPDAPCAGTSITIDCSTLAVSAGYSVKVTPVVGALSGPPAAAVPLFATGLYLSAPLNAGNPVTPNITPAVDFTRSAFDIPLYLPEIFNPPPGTLPAPPANFGFALAPQSAAPFKYVLTIPGASPAWTFGADSIRAAVATAVAGLRAWLETNNVTGYGMQLVNDLVGRAMPQSFGETLLYGAGFNQAQGIVDLRPGHVLRVEYEAYQYQGTANPAAKYLNGFVGANVSTYQVVSTTDASGRWLIGIDAFLGQLSSYMSVPKPDATAGQSQGGGGVADLFFAAFRQPYCRIVYPAQFFGQGESGSAYLSYNIAFVAASTLSALDTATSNIRSHSIDLGSAVAVYFRGRPVVSVGSQIWVDGIERFAPLGTTVGNVLESLGRRPPYAALPLSGLSLQRARGAVVTDGSVVTSGVGIDSALPVALDWNPAASGAISASWLDLPVLPGDRLWLGAL